MQAIVRIRETSSDRLAFVTTLHELGHVVGLAHDQFISSLMYPRMVTDELNTATTRLTDSDVRLVMSTYGL
jgi:predicted Zn-dependent protease